MPDFALNNQNNEANRIEIIEPSVFSGLMVRANNSRIDTNNPIENSTLDPNSPKKKIVLEKTSAKTIAVNIRCLSIT